MSLEKIGIIGAGRIGSGIAFLTAKAKCEVVLVDSSRENLEKAVDFVRKKTQTLVEKKEMDSDEALAIVGRLQLALDVAALAKMDLIIESVAEDDTIKLNLFAQLDEIISYNAVIASNSSLVPITKLAGVTNRSGMVVGMHFFDPVADIGVVEVVRAVQTSEKTMEKALGFIERLGKQFVVSNDFPGFIVNRVLATTINEAIQVLYEGVASASDIDKAISLGGQMSMGPLAYADMIGLDVLLSNLYYLQREFGNPKYAPSPLLVKYVEAGYFGRKAGRGFFEY